jgi:hypothetical protein
MSLLIELAALFRQRHPETIPSSSGREGAFHLTELVRRHAGGSPTTLFLEHNVPTNEIVFKLRR